MKITPLQKVEKNCVVDGRRSRGRLHGPGREEGVRPRESKVEREKSWIGDWEPHEGVAESFDDDVQRSKVAVVGASLPKRS